MIPYTSEIVDCSLRVLNITQEISSERKYDRRAFLLNHPDLDSGKVDALQLLLVLVKTLPNFLGSDLSRIVHICTLYAAESSIQATLVLEAIAEKVSSKTLLPVVAVLGPEKGSSNVSVEVHRPVNHFNIMLLIS